MSQASARRRSAPQETVTRHGRLRRPNPFALALKVVAASLAVALVAGISLGAFAVWRLNSNIDVVELAGSAGADIVEPPALGRYEGGFDLLIAGSDECDNPGGCEEEGRDEVLNDVTMLLHVAEDQQSAVAVSFPRDLIVSIPSCPQEGGGSSAAMSAQQINVSLFYGGLPCTVLTVEELTGLDISYGGVIKFRGVIGMSNAIGGVEICTDGPIDDPRANGLYLPSAGTHTLQGEQALGFLRSRYGVGNGGDLGRISSQQMFLSSLVRKIKDEQTLTDPAKLYGLASAATSNMTLSSTLTANTMVSMAVVLKDIPLERITFVQYPATPDGNRVYPIESQADELFRKIRADESFAPEGTGVGSAIVPGTETPPSTEPEVPVDPAAPTDPATPIDPAAPTRPAGPEVLEGVTGQTAADNTCARANN